MDQPYILTPDDIRRLSDCTLQFHFWQQVTPEHFVDASEAGLLLKQTVLKTIQHLHALGGPNRLNLPATLRAMQAYYPDQGPNNTAFAKISRQMVAHYHRQLRIDWPKVIASGENLGLTLRLRSRSIRCEASLDRIDQEDDGGVTGIEFVVDPGPVPEMLPQDDVRLTMIHALIAAAYPNKRPVRVKTFWLYQDQVLTLELSEAQYRRNLETMRHRAQAWLEGEVLARPGLHCETCPFMYQGCPIYTAE